jgi:hypothetical protein
LSIDSSGAERVAIGDAGNCIRIEGESDEGRRDGVEIVSVLGREV